MPRKPTAHGLPYPDHHSIICPAKSNAVRLRPVPCPECGRTFPDDPPTDERTTR